MARINDDANIEIMKNYFEAIRTGNTDLLATLFADDIVWHQPGMGQLSGTYTGKDQVFALFGKFMSISRGSFKIDSVGHIMSNGTFVAGTVHFSASNVDNSISMNGVDLMKIKSGRIQEVWLFSEDPIAEDKFWR